MGTNKHLRSLLREKREAAGLRSAELAERIGYKNRSKGSTRIFRFEREGVASEELVAKLIEGLEIDTDEVLGAQRKDRAGWEAWVDEPVPMVLIVRLMPAVYQERSLPESVTTEEDAIQYARDFARTKRFKVCLVLSRRESVWIGEDGGPGLKTYAEPGVLNIPWMQTRGTGKFLLASQ